MERFMSDAKERDDVRVLQTFPRDNLPKVNLLVRSTGQAEKATALTKYRS